MLDHLNTLMSEEINITYRATLDCFRQYREVMSRLCSENTDRALPDKSEILKEEKIFRFALQTEKVSDHR